MKEQAPRSKVTQHKNIGDDQVNANASTAAIEDNRPITTTVKQLKAIAAGANPSGSDNGKNNNGLPSDLKSGIESLSGLAMDDVKVHYNSDKPAQLNAHAYAQGTDIHVAPGQEKHLPHEAWHVVQQKQGRVQPTTQAKGKVAINDDEGLENEADTMGARAMLVQTKSAHKKTAHIHSSSLQLKLREASTFNELDEQGKDAISTTDVEQLGVTAGLDRKIETEGDVSWRSKVGGWFGDEGTWSKFLNAVELYNNAETIEEKQSHLLAVKKEAQTWLKQKEDKTKMPSDNAEDKSNDQKKLETINRFINLTTSNQPKILEQYAELDTEINKFKEDVIGNKDSFKKLITKYKSLESIVDNFKSTYPPSVNLHFKKEWQGIQNAKNNVSQPITIQSDSKSIGDKLEILDPTCVIDITKPNISISAGLAVDVAGITVDKSTKLSIELNENGDYKSFKIVDGKLDANIAGMEVKLDGLSYANEVLSATSAMGKVKLLDNEVSIEATNAKIERGEFNYDSLVGRAESIDSQLGIQINQPSIKYFKGKSFEIRGDLAIVNDYITKAKGIAIITLDDDKNLKNVKIKNGRGQANVGNVLLEFNGLAYNYSAGTFSIQEASGNLTIFDHTVGLNLYGASISKNKFDYKKIEGELPDVDYGFFSLAKTQIAYTKESGAFQGKTTYSFNTKEIPAGFSDLKTSGELDIFWNPEGEKYYSINDGELTFKLLGQEASAKKFNYSSKEQKIEAGEMSLDFGVKDFKKTFNGKNISISKDGINFTELSTEASGQPFDVKIFSLTPKQYKLEKDENNKLRVSAHGALNFDMPKYLGVESKGEVEGDVGLSADESITPDYHITKGKAEVKMANPLNKISEVLGDNWSSSRYEVSATIPVFPAVSAIFGIYMQYGAQFAQELGAIIELNEAGNEIVLHTKTNIPVKAEGGVFGGIQGGSQLLIALALLLKAAGKFDMNTELGYEKNFPLNEKGKGNKVKEDAGFTYDIKGDLKVGAYLDIVATALYFFRKEFSLALGEKSLGQFEFSNKKPEKKPEPGDNALASKEELEKHIDPSVKEEAKGLTIEQLLDLDSTHRFAEKEKSEAVDIIKTAEKSRLDTFTSESKTLKADEQKFNNVPLANLQLYDQFMINRCNWNKIHEVISTLTPLKTKDEAGGDYIENTLLPELRKLGEATNMAEKFVKHYHDKIEEFKKYQVAYPSVNLQPYLDVLNEKHKIFSETNTIKRFVHSQRKGDDKQQESQTKTSGWFFGFGKSNYEEFSEALGKYADAMATQQESFKKAEKLSKDIGMKLVQAHQQKSESKVTGR